MNYEVRGAVQTSYFLVLNSYFKKRSPVKRGYRSSIKQKKAVFSTAFWV